MVFRMHCSIFMLHIMIISQISGFKQHKMFYKFTYTI